MSQVTVGVPVYNGAEFLEKSLACLRDQTFRDIEVLIFDNCSDDATPEIAQAFCAQDPRFRYFRQPVNKGPVANFLGVLEAANTPFFMWRAADDTSGLDYIETLLALLAAKPDRDIAVARIVSALPGGRVKKIHDVSPWIEKGGAVGRLAQLFRSHHASWIYGVFRREAMLPILREVISRYPYVRGWDNVTMFPFEFDGKVTGTNATSFYQYLPFSPGRGSAAQRAAGDDAKIEQARLFMEFAHEYVSRTIKSPAQRCFYHAAVTYFGNKRAVGFRKRLRRRLIHAFGLSKAPAPPCAKS